MEATCTEMIAAAIEVVAADAIMAEDVIWIAATAAQCQQQSHACTIRISQSMWNL